MTLWTLVRFVHVLGAVVWVGGQLTLTLMVAPVLRVTAAGTVQAAALRAIGRRFAAWANLVVLPLQLATGLALAWHRGVVLESLTAPGYGRTLGIKVVLATAAVAAAAAHGAAAARRAVGLQRPLALASLALSLGVVLAAVSLVP
jgi:uncharacterized membrane protein